MTRARDTYTFSAGPAMLPDEVLRQIQVDLQDWRGSGFSLLEASQWDADLLEMLAHVEADLRLLLGVTDDYAVMFLHGGASNQFAMVPMNLLRGRRSADYEIGRAHV
jgi:phosphoserine aminotransferase